MRRIILSFVLVIFLSSCAAVATRKGDTMVLKGWGARSAKWEDGAEITKDEPIEIPNNIPFAK